MDDRRVVLIFLLKQKTAYEMRISDWSSDVYSAESRSETINGATVRPLKGELDKRQALQRLLEGTNLEAVYSADDAATIRPPGKEPLTKEGNKDGPAVEISSGDRDDETSPANVTPRQKPMPSEPS